MFLLIPYHGPLAAVAFLAAVLALGAVTGLVTSRLLRLRWTRADAIVDAMLSPVSLVAGIILALWLYHSFPRGAGEDGSQLIQRAGAIAVAVLILTIALRHIGRLVLRQRDSPG
jgi:hypothetical protein